MDFAFAVASAVLSADERFSAGPLVVVFAPASAVAFASGRFPVAPSAGAPVRVAAFGLASVAEPLASLAGFAVGWRKWVTAQSSTDAAGLVVIVAVARVALAAARAEAPVVPAAVVSVDGTGLRRPRWPQR